LAGNPALIDVHHHARPPHYAETMALAGVTHQADRPVPEWRKEESLEMMERHGIATAILSLPDAEYVCRSREIAVRLTRPFNDMLAGLIAALPHRFGGFGNIGLPHLDLALPEISYVLDNLKLDGVLLNSNYGGVYPGDPVFDPVFAELNRRKAVVFVHPAFPAGEASATLNLPPYLLEFIIDTTRCIANMLAHEIPGRYPDIRFIFSHAGGVAPYIPFRFATVDAMRQLPKVADFAALTAKYEKALSGFYYDTAMSAGETTIATLAQIAGPGRILFGTDFPRVPPVAIDATKKNILALENDSLRSAIAHGNAVTLFPRLSTARSR
jgi:predicted TIM-barrel fold metal-dependent hydrolase